MCNHLYRSHFLFLHGSVLERAGKSYLFLGDSNAGKTTLILKLRNRGFNFFSDEFAPIDLTSGLIQPFPRSIFLRSDGRRLLPELSDELTKLPFFDDYQEIDRETGAPIRRLIIAPEAIYKRTGRFPAPVGGIFFLDTFGTPETTIHPLPAVSALEKLLDHCVNNRYLTIDHQEGAIAGITEILKDSPAFSLHQGHLDEDPAVMAQTITGSVNEGRALDPGDLDLVLQKCRNLGR